MEPHRIPTASRAEENEGAPGNTHIEQMICVTDIANSEILGVTWQGALIRSIDSSLGRTHFDNPTWKPADLATFQSNAIIGLPGQ
jgi:hypothetical protein